MEGFGQVIVATRLQPADAIAGVTPSREKQDGDLDSFSPDGFADRPPVRSR